MHTVTVNFGGFYASMHSDLIDELIARHFNSDIGDVSDDQFDSVDMKELNRKYCKEFIEFVNHSLKEQEVDAKFTFKEIFSPREYNFSTDTIQATIPTPDVLNLIKYVESNYKEELAALLHEVTTPRSGYFPLYTIDELQRDIEAYTMVCLDVLMDNEGILSNIEWCQYYDIQCVFEMEIPLVSDNNKQEKEALL